MAIKILGRTSRSSKRNVSTNLVSGKSSQFSRSGYLPTIPAPFRGSTDAVDYIIVAGGGGAGGNSLADKGGGGGGAGGYLSGAGRGLYGTSLAVNTGVYTITVGGGGDSVTQAGGGGGGGSGYYSPSLATNGALYTGSSTTPGNSGDSRRGTAGNTATAGKIYLS